MPQDGLPEDRQETPPLMPPDSVLRRIDDDIQLSDRRAGRSAIFGHTLDGLLTLAEESLERSRDRRAKTEGRARMRRQVTNGLGFNAYPRRWRPALAVLVFLLFVALSVAGWLVH